MSTTSQAVLQHLPFLRRYARALTGNQASGDAYVAAAVESLIASPKMLDSSGNKRVALYRLFTKIWNSVPVNEKADAEESESRSRTPPHANHSPSPAGLPPGGFGRLFRGGRGRDPGL